MILFSLFGYRDNCNCYVVIFEVISGLEGSIFYGLLLKKNYKLKFLWNDIVFLYIFDRWRNKNGYNFYIYILNEWYN